MKKLLLSIFVVFVLFSLTGCRNVKHDISEYILTLDYEEDYRILQLTDLHIGAKDDRQREYDLIQKTINEANPNLIVITGDTFTFADRKTAKEVFSMFEKQTELLGHDVYWTITWGNHDEQCYFSIDWVTGYLNKLSLKEGSHCVFKDIQDDDIQGNANFAINLMNGSTIKEQIIIIDSNRYAYNPETGEFHYDWIKEEQVEWYKELVSYTTDENGGTPVESIAYFHIPIPQFDACRCRDGNEKAKYDALTIDVDILQGYQREGICCPKKDTGLYDAIKEGGSTVAVCCGHDHSDDFVAYYENIYLVYGVCGTDRVYYDEDMIGGTLLILHETEGTISLDRWGNTARNSGDSDHGLEFILIDGIEY